MAKKGINFSPIFMLFFWRDISIFLAEYLKIIKLLDGARAKLTCLTNEFSTYAPQEIKPGPRGIVLADMAAFLSIYLFIVEQRYA